MENRAYQDWKFQNPGDLKPKEVRGTGMKWYTNDCHEKPLWHGRKSCLNKSDFVSMMKNKKEDKEGLGDKTDSNFQKDSLKDFKVALTAIILEDDFKVLQEEFVLVKD